jgi:hypothetical protein
VKAILPIREVTRNRKRFYALAVTLLAFGLFSQAVHAKNSDYFPTAPHSTRYSTTIKIADLAHHIVVADPATVSVTYEIVALTQPKFTRTSYVPEVPAQELSAQISFRPLRSPPVIL